MYKFKCKQILTKYAIGILFLQGMLISQYAIAAADDDISTTATISYVLGGVAGSQDANSVFKEDRLINFTVSKVNQGEYDRVRAGLTNSVMTFSIINTGNDTQDFLLAAVNVSINPLTSPADSFDTLLPLRTFVESGASTGFQLAEDTIAFVDELAPNSAAIIYVLADIPSDIDLDEVAAVALVAQVAQGNDVSIEGAAITNDDNAHISPASPSSGYSNGATSVTSSSLNDTPNTLGLETVFNDPAGSSASDISSASVQDVVANGQHASSGAFLTAPLVTIVNSVSVVDTQGGSEVLPGSTLRYQLNVTVAGNASVENLIIKDPIPENTQYVDGSLSLNGVTQTDIDDAPTDYSLAVNSDNKPVTSIEVDLSESGSRSVLSGAVNIINFEVTID